MMLRISDTIRRTETADGGILLDVQRGQMFCLNAVGASILELIERGYDEAQIAEQISRESAVNQQVVREDVIEFIATLRKHQVVQPAPRAEVL
jgi:Coenzyme PQQ synthesis protein D (PqqD)